MENSREVEKAAAIRQLVQSASMILWHRHCLGEMVEYSVTITSEDGKRFSTDGHTDLLHTLLESIGVLLTKHCGRCNRSQPLMQFSGDGADRWCLTCRRERAREYRASKRGVRRRCSRCCEDKRCKDFSANNRWCKACRKAYARMLREERRRQQGGGSASGPTPPDR